MTQMDNEDPSSDPQNLYKSQAPQHTCIILMLVRQRQRQPWGLDRQSKQKKKPQDQREVLKKKKKKDEKQQRKALTSHQVGSEPHAYLSACTNVHAHTPYVQMSWK
jgi:type II secretory pathway predicted ATPase ExeA